MSSLMFLYRFFKVKQFIQLSATVTEMVTGLYVTGCIPHDACCDREKGHCLCVSYSSKLYEAVSSKS